MLRTEEIYGSLPDVIGSVPLDIKELMFWLYCPIKLAGDDQFALPTNLDQFGPIIYAIATNEKQWPDLNVYLTAKRLWCAPGAMGQRPGWHSDGFLTDDINYIWYDAVPTVFFGTTARHSFSADHDKSMQEMHRLCEARKTDHYRFPARTLLRLTEACIHRPATHFEPCFRTFVKVSLSRAIYAHEGNSINHSLSTGWAYSPRAASRNCPQTSKGRDFRNHQTTTSTGGRNER